MNSETKFSHTRRTTEEAYRLFFNALGSHTAAAVVEQAAEFFGVPVIVTDEHYRLIHMCPDTEIGEKVYDSYHRRSVLNEAEIRLFQETYLSNVKYFYEPFYSNTGPAEAMPRIFGELHSKDKILGHFSINLGDQELYDTDIACAAVFQKAMEYVLTENSRSSDTRLARCLNDLLTLSAGISLRSYSAELIAKSIPGNYALMVTPIGSSASQQAYAAMKTNEICQNEGMLSTLHQNCIVTLIGSIGSDVYTDAERTELEKAAAGLTSAGNSGLSTPFANLMTLPDHFNEAFLARATGTAVLNLFTEEMPAPLFEALCRRLNASIFMHPAIARIREYDTDNDTDYFKTLRSYSLNMHNKENTARALHIHRNTLLYRLNRIAELFNLDIEDARTALILLNSFQLQDTLEARAKSK